MSTIADGYLDLPPGKIASVVTSLEMRERPAIRDDRPTPGAELRAVATPDPHWYRELYRRVGEEWLWFSRLRMPVDELRAIIHDPDVEVYAVSLHGADEGLLELDFRAGEACELAFFGLTPAARGIGAGRWLMNRTIERVWSRPVSRLWVHTCTLDHPQALSFYRRSGFVPVRRQIEVADDPRLAGVLDRGAAPEIPLL